MFDSVVSATLTALLGAFAGALLSRIVEPMVNVMQNGNHASAQSAQTIINYVQVATDNWVRAALLSALVVLLARAVVESEVRA